MLQGGVLRVERVGGKYQGTGPCQTASLSLGTVVSNTLCTNLRALASRRVTRRVTTAVRARRLVLILTSQHRG